MDPRHPELAISRMRELMKQYDRIESDISNATTSSKLGQLEREGGLVVQEICLVAPRMHESLIQSSRQRRHDISRGLVEKPVEKSAQSVRKEPSETTQSVKETEVEPKNKTTRKKKTTKKKEDK